MHGSNEPAIDEFRTRQNLDAHQRPIDAVFASDDAIWPLYFAVVNRPVAQSYINWCEHVTSRRLGAHSRYLFSIGSDPRRRALVDDRDDLPPAARDVSRRRRRAASSSASSRCGRARGYR